MASYSDYIKIQDYLPIYDITADSSNKLWPLFIPTNQFCELLQRTLTAISSADNYKRKSIWVQGTFGTGKSHASSVVSHLLCDDYSNIEFYLNKIDNANLREQLRNFRKNKRLFPVVIKGVEGAYDVPRFSLSLQREVKRALRQAGYENIIINTDFENAIQYIKNHQKYAQDAINNCDELKDISPTTDEIISLLENNNIQAYLEFDKALNQTVGATLTPKNISEWLAGMENAIEQKGIADGLIIFWDEFTSIMETISSDRINVLQNIAEKSQSCNLFLFIISHRVEEQIQLGGHRDDIETMNDRFDIVRYVMDEVSTYRVMRHSFDPIEKSNYDALKYVRTNNLQDTIEYLCQDGCEEERVGISNLFPIHPYSAYLCSKLSDYVGSANRSVVNFMHDEQKGFRKFISDETIFERKGLLTAEWLWDFFYDSFETNPLCGAFISNYQSYIQKVTDAGENYVRVYKGILLLNTLTTQFSSKSQDVIARLSPSEQSIRGLFADDCLESQIDDILKFLDTHQIISRDVFGDFKISVSSLNPVEVNTEKRKVASQYDTAESILSYNLEAKAKLTTLFEVGSHLIRKCEPQIFSCSNLERIIQNKLSKYTTDKPNHLHIALYLAVNIDERNNFEKYAKQFSINFPNSLHIVIDEVLSMEARSKFIEFLANRNIAKSHYQESVEKESERAAKELVNQWVNRLINNTFYLYFNGEKTCEGIMANSYVLINKKFSHKIFSKGLESVKAFRTTTDSFLANKNCPKLVLQMLQSQTRDKLTHFTGSDVPGKYIFEDNENHLIDEECNLTSFAINGNTWIAQICNKVDECIENAKNKYVDKFSLSEVFAPLMKPPYGFFPSRANWIAFPFALRKHKADMFLPSISQPVSDERLAEMIKDMFVMWNDGHSEASNKLLLRFGSKEESELTKVLYEVFQLNLIDDIPTVKSLNNVRWGINEFCMKKSQYPLWVLAYCNNVSKSRAAIIKLMIDVLESDSNPNIEKIKTLSNQINSEKVDIAQLVSNPNNYEEGFINYIKSIPTVKIENDWWKELLEEISHIQSEVAFRKESDVRECVYAFHNKKRDQQNNLGKSTVSDDNETKDEQKTGQDKPPIKLEKQISEENVNKAKNLVKESHMPSALWQQVLLDVIEGNPEISDFIIKYLS